MDNSYIPRFDATTTVVKYREDSAEPPLRFLDLPAELRYMVYDYATDHYAIYNHVYNLCPGARRQALDCATYYYIRTLNMNLRLANKKLKAEVDHRVMTATAPATFVFEECDPYTDQWIMPKRFPPCMLRNIRHAVFKIEAFCLALYTCTGMCMAANDVKANCHYAHAVVSGFPNLVSCGFELDIVSQFDDELLYPEVRHAPDLPDSIKELTEIDKLTSVKVWKVKENQHGERFKEMWVCWNKTQELHGPLAQEVAEGRYEFEEITEGE
jgi:hypothetical protein